MEMLLLGMEERLMKLQQTLHILTFKDSQPHGIEKQYSCNAVFLALVQIFCHLACNFRQYCMQMKGKAFWFNPVESD